MMSVDSTDIPEPLEHDDASVLDPSESKLLICCSTARSAAGGEC